MPTLAVYRGEAIVHLLDLKGTTIRIGRLPELNDLVLPDDGKAVSRSHAELQYHDGAYYIFDQKSPNGTWIDGRRVSQAEMTAGREVVIGPYRLVLREGDTVPGGSIDPLVTAAVEADGREQVGRAKTVVRATASKTSSKWGPISVTTADVQALLRKRPVVVGSGVTIGVLIIAALVWWRPAQSAPPPVSTTATVTSPPVDPPPPPAEPSEDPTTIAVAEHLQKARAHFDNREFAEATAEAEEVLKLNADNSEAMDLLSRAKSPTAEAAPATPRVPRVKPPPTPLDDPNVPRRSGENEVDYRARVDQAARDFEAAKALYKEGEWLKAEAAFRAIIAEFPNGYIDATTYMTLARDAKQEAARVAIRAAQDAEKQGDPPTVRREFEKAGELGHPDAAHLSKEFEARMAPIGKDALKTARNYDSMGRNQQAIEHFEKVVRYLPPGDPDRVYAEQRLKALRQK